MQKLHALNLLRQNQVRILLYLEYCCIDIFSPYKFKEYVVVVQKFCGTN